MEMFDQEITGIKKESSKMPVVEATLIEITKNMELMRLLSKKLGNSKLYYRTWRRMRRSDQ